MSVAMERMFSKIHEMSRRSEFLSKSFSECFENWNNCGFPILLQLDDVCINDYPRVVSRRIIIKSSEAILIIIFKNGLAVRSQISFSSTLNIEEQNRTKEILYNFYKYNHDKIFEKVIFSHNIDFK